MIINVNTMCSYDIYILKSVFYNRKLIKYANQEIYFSWELVILIDFNPGNSL